MHADRALARRFIDSYARSGVLGALIGAAVFIAVLTLMRVSPLGMAVFIGGVCGAIGGFLMGGFIGGRATSGSTRMRSRPMKWTRATRTGSQSRSASLTPTKLRRPWRCSAATAPANAQTARRVAPWNLEAVSPLDEYKAKRISRRPPSPQATGRARDGEARFVIQQHSATRLHWDLRLERDGVLPSWALTAWSAADPRTIVSLSARRIIRSSTSTSTARSRTEATARAR